MIRKRKKLPRGITIAGKSELMQTEWNERGIAHKDNVQKQKEAPPSHYDLHNKLSNSTTGKWKLIPVKICTLLFWVKLHSKQSRCIVRSDLCLKKIHPIYVSSDIISGSVFTRCSVIMSAPRFRPPSPLFSILSDFFPLHSQRFPRFFIPPYPFFPRQSSYTPPRLLFLVNRSFTTEGQ